LPFSQALYDAAQYIQANLLGFIRTVLGTDTVLPDDNNKSLDILKYYLEAIGHALPITPRYVAYNDDILSKDYSDLVTSCDDLLDTITFEFGDPYTTDYDWNPLVTLIATCPTVKFGDWGSPTMYNYVFDYLGRITSLILRHGPALPPSLVVSVSSGNFTEWSSMRKTFYAKGRYWVFYGKDGYIYWKSSSDGSTWSAETLAWSDPYIMSVEGSFDVYYDSDNVALFFARGQGVPTGGHQYIFRKGTLNTDGTITWDTARYLWSGYYDGHYPAIGRGADGLWWVAFGFNPSSMNFQYRIYSSPDGVTWTQRYYKDGIPTFNARYVTTFILPTSPDGKVYFIFIDYFSGLTTHPYLYSNKWDGASMTELPTHELTNPTQALILKKNLMCGDIDGNNKMHIVWKGADGALYYKNYDGSNWSSETQLDSATVSEPCISVDRNTNTIHVFWIKNNIIYHRKYVSSWEAIDTPFGTTFDSPTYLTSDKDGLGNIMASWREGTAAPYSIYFGRI